jgi:hypothetical protein
MLGDGSPPSLTVDQAMRTWRSVAPVRLIRAVPRPLAKGVPCDVDRAATTLRPPSKPGAGPSDAERLPTIPGVGPQPAATLLGELGALTRVTDARALVAYVGF